MFEGIKNKVLIISSPRTGSTPLLYSIHKHIQRNYPNVLRINEPVLDAFKTDTPYGIEHGRQIFAAEQFSNLIKEKQFVVKLHAREYNLHFSTLLNKHLHNLSVVRIRRRDILNQCVSFYISLMTRLWVNTGSNNELLEEIVLPIRRDQIVNTLMIIRSLNAECDAFNGQLFLDLFYEDLDFKEPGTVKNSKIKNQEEIEQVFKQFLSVYFPDNT